MTKISFGFRQLRICILIMTLISCDEVFSNQLKELYLQGFLPMTGTGWTGGGACLPAVLMALRHVNGRAGLLDEYNLNYSWVDTQVNLFYLRNNK